MSADAYGTGVTYAKRGSWNDAAVWFQRACEMEPTNLAFHLDWGEALMKAGRYDEAAQAYERVAHTLRGDRDGEALVRYFLGGAFIRAGQVERALVELERSVALNPRLLEARGLRGVALAQMGQNVAARQSFAEVLAACPHYFEEWPVSFEGSFLVSPKELEAWYERARLGH